ncbi:glutaredoxin 1 [Bisgaardia hudsonensis]|uniref:Glutaredoxin 1 n=1 Tax=Bisgaardia hudsonensis TaxID=109472 RepID=A0A4R2N2R9_9PAST|nr:GrxA family glutaredoxin [Bisgaardia hudsonensis]QLB12585.1 glutaredoxin [Bisgaardia hudsonensis]TCP14127.1 glutaredoxin 1 [Bisgaardia hudsonensis]
MFVKIYGRAGCPFCVRAKNLAEELKNTASDFDYQYTDINEAGMTKDDLSVLAGKTVTTVPQIFIDEKHIGGCTDFEALMGKGGSWFSKLFS